MLRRYSEDREFATCTGDCRETTQTGETNKKDGKALASVKGSALTADEKNVDHQQIRKDA
jgi:hypothetical protein